MRRVLISARSAARGFAPVANRLRPMRVRCRKNANTTITTAQIATDGGIPTPKVLVTGSARSISHCGG